MSTTTKTKKRKRIVQNRNCHVCQDKANKWEACSQCEEPICNKCQYKVLGKVCCEFDWERVARKEIKREGLPFCLFGCKNMDDIIELCANRSVLHLKPGQDLVRSWVPNQELVDTLREQYSHPEKKWYQFPFKNEREKAYYKQVGDQIERMNLPWCLFGMDGIAGLLDIAEHPITKKGLMRMLVDEYESCVEMSAQELCQ